MNLDETCEAIFQLHKQSNIGKTLTWTKEIGQEYKLSRDAKPKMLQEEILQDASTTKHEITTLNPKVYGCENYNQAIALLKYKTKYALSVFLFFDKNGFDGEYPWSQISEHCNIPPEDWQTTRVILINQEFIYKSGSSDDGYSVKANEENIISALHGLEKKTTPPTGISVTAGILNFQSPVENQYQDSSSENSININPPKHKNAITAKTILKWFFIILGGIAAFLTITKLAWNWP